MNTIELIIDIVLFGGTLPENRNEEVRNFLDKQLEAITVTPCCTELKCDCGNTEDVKNIPTCASCYNPNTGEW